MNNEQAENQSPDDDGPTTEEEICILKVALQEIGPAAVPGLIKMSSREDWRLRAGAAGLLGEISPFPEAAVTTILHAMEDQS
jgi:HEAT repeat protein